MARYDIADKRNSRRVFSRIPATCEIFHPKDKTRCQKNMTICNLTTEGMYLETDELLPINTELNIRFNLPSCQEATNACVKIIRVEAEDDGKTFGLGGVFSNLPIKDKDMIKKIIELTDINKLLELCIKEGGSDLHLAVNSPPILRIEGELSILDLPVLNEEAVVSLVYSLMDNQQIKKFELEKEFNFGFQFDSDNRFRINVHQERGFVGAVIRLINRKISSFEELHIPDAAKALARLNEGLVLIVGPTGSGKTTTASAMVELLNQERKLIVTTLERPIEYVHKNIKSIIKQREVGVDTHSFSEALRNSLKQDPDVLVIGELDDVETIKTAIVAAEAGALVIATFHAPNTVQAIDRLANMFPPENRRQTLFQLSQCLKGIITQMLIPRKDIKGRVLACEVAIVNNAVKRVIHFDDLIQLPTIIQTGSASDMQSMQDSIKQYLNKGIISEEMGRYFSEESVKYR